MTIHAVRFESFPRPEAWARWRWRARSSSATAAPAPRPPAFGPPWPPRAGPLALSWLASRDVRLLAAAVGTAVGHCYWTLAVLAAASALTVAARLLAARRADPRL